MRNFILTCAGFLFFVGCSQKPDAIMVVKQPTNIQKVQTHNNIAVTEMPATFGIEKWEGTRAVDTVVVHSAYCLDGDAYDPKNLYNVFKKYNVTPHYMIGRDGTIYKMADENDLAHHAGVSKMADGRESVNRFSIGIEVINSLIDYPTKEQYISLAKLIRDIKSRHDIKYIVGHSDIAPHRKTDPWNFDFGMLRAMIDTDKHAKDTNK